MDGQSSRGVLPVMNMVDHASSWSPGKGQAPTTPDPSPPIPSTRVTTFSASNNNMPILPSPPPGLLSARGISSVCPPGFWPVPVPGSPPGLLSAYSPAGFLAMTGALGLSSSAPANTMATPPGVTVHRVQVSTSAPGQVPPSPTADTTGEMPSPTGDKKTKAQRDPADPDAPPKKRGRPPKPKPEGWVPPEPTKRVKREEDPDKKPRRKVCAAEGCNTNPSFGLKGQLYGELYCVKHKSPEMVDVKHGRCEQPGCPKVASFGFLRTRFCTKHKLPGMHDIVNRKCKHPDGCSKRATFGKQGMRSVFCGDHKEEGMVDTRWKCWEEPDIKVDDVVHRTVSSMTIKGIVKEILQAPDKPKPTYKVLYQFEEEVSEEDLRELRRAFEAETVQKTGVVAHTPRPKKKKCEPQYFPPGERPVRKRGRPSNALLEAEKRWFESHPDSGADDPGELGDLSAHAQPGQPQQPADHQNVGMQTAAPTNGGAALPASAGPNAPVGQQQGAAHPSPPALNGHVHHVSVVL